jgi:putative SOS response-associated peptidase YedK
MCGKFTAMASWAEVVAFSQPLTRAEVKEGDNDRVVTYRVMDNLPLIVWDGVARRVVPTRWGWPQKNWKIPKFIHARSESIETTLTFAPAFLKGQRGIVVMRTFNEAPSVPGPTIQHTITPGELGGVGIAFLWHQLDVPEIGGSLPACVMVTVEANQLIKTLPTDRMPVVLADEDWDMWLRGTSDGAKACLRTVEGVRWTMTKEEKAATEKRKKASVSDPTGLF